MRALVITSLFCASALTGCKLHGVIHSPTPQINAADLAVKHVYKIPKKNNHYLTRFNDPQLQQLISVALVDAPDIRSAKARIMRAREVAKGAYSVLWPSATLNGAASQQHFSFQGAVPPHLTK